MAYSPSHFIRAGKCEKEMCIPNMAFKGYHDNMRFSIELDLGVPYFWTHIFYTEDNFEARVDMQQSFPIFEELVNTSLDSQYDSLTKLNHSCFYS